LAVRSPPLCNDCFEVCSGLDFIDIRFRTLNDLNDNGAIYINNSLCAGGRVLDTQDRSSYLKCVIHSFFGTRRIEYFAARFVHLEIAAIGVINALEVRRKRGGAHFVVLEDTFPEDGNSSISVYLARYPHINGIKGVYELKSCSILIVGVTDGERRGDVPDGSV